jgi:protein HIRA/HIR1
VKGITWDPAGQFLAAQSDDRTVKVYRTSDWKIEKEITAPYQNGNTTTFFRRLRFLLFLITYLLFSSWSPDGTSIATVNGENSGICVAPVIYRTDWQSSVCLVGHDAPVEVACFNPHLFTLTDPKTNEKTQTTVLALGSQDNGLSIWWTGSARAVCSIRDLFTHSILDLCWTSDGLGLYACSYDGSIAYLQFEPSDFGSRVSTSEKVRQVLEFYLFFKGVKAAKIWPN